MKLKEEFLNFAFDGIKETLSTHQIIKFMELWLEFMNHLDSRLNEDGDKFDDMFELWVLQKLINIFLISSNAYV